MGDLSRNFSTGEFACHHGISNPHERLVAALQEYRDKLGTPLKITSACRCPECGEKGDTPHFTTADHPAIAADCIALGPDLLDMYWAALEIDSFMKGGIGIYPYENPLQGFLHLDVRPWRARWSRVNGVYQTHQYGLTHIYDRLVGLAPQELQLVDTMQPGNVSWLTDKIYKVPKLVR